MNTPATVERLRSAGVMLVAPERRSPGYLRGFVAAKIDKWAGPMTAGGLSFE
jgi:hypothetical protein